MPRNWGKYLTLLASMSVEGMGPCLAVEGSTTREVFEAYLEHVLAPTLRPGQVMVIDNLTAHKGERVRELIEAMGRALEKLTARDARGFLEHRGYRALGQLL